MKTEEKIKIKMDSNFRSRFHNLPISESRSVEKVEKSVIIQNFSRRKEMNRNRDSISWEKKRKKETWDS